MNENDLPNESYKNHGKNIYYNFMEENILQKKNYQQEQLYLKEGPQLWSMKIYLKFKLTKKSTFKVIKVQNQEDEYVLHSN